MTDEIWCLPEEDRDLFKSNPRRAKSRMREEYIKSRIPLESLARHYGLSRSVLQRIVDSGRWEEKRTAYSASVFSTFLASSREHENAKGFFLKRIEDAALATLARHLEIAAKSGARLDLEEMDKISRIYERIAKQKQLSSGQPTSITKNFTSPTLDDLNSAMGELRESDKDILDDIEQ